MKKFILAILLLFSLTASAQFYDEYGNLLVVINDTTAIKVVNTDTLRFRLTNTTPLSTDIVSLPLTTKSYSVTDTIAGDWIDTLSASIQGVLATATSEISLTNFNVGGSTVGFGLSYYLAIVTDDTLEISYTIDFTRGTVITIKPGSWKSSDVKFYDITIYPDWYLRRKGTAGTVEYNVTVEGQ